MVIPRKRWTERIADITSREEYQNAVIQVRNPKLRTVTNDVKTGTVTITGDPVVWTGQARMVGFRSVVDSNKGNLSNPTGNKAIRFQVPRESTLPRVERGWQIRVIDGGDNPRAGDYVFIIESDVQGSNVASRTIEASVDVEVVAGWE